MISAIRNKSAIESGSVLVDNKDRENELSGGNLNGMAANGDALFEIYPNALREIPFHGVEGIDNFIGTLIHEYAHLFCGAIQ